MVGGGRRDRPVSCLLAVRIREGKLKLKLAKKQIGALQWLKVGVIWFIVRDPANKPERNTCGWQQRTK
jgi:hypothetical protein